MRRVLNLGCGLSDFHRNEPTVQYVNIDADPKVQADLRDDLTEPLMIELKHGLFDHIQASDILEHIPADRCFNVLGSWTDLLVEGGTITIQVPDPYLLFDKLRSGELDEEEINRVIFGECTNQWDRHYQLISTGRLRRMLKNLGLKITDERRLHVCAIVTARKP